MLLFVCLFVVVVVFFCFFLYIRMLVFITVTSCFLFYFFKKIGFFFCFFFPLVVVCLSFIYCFCLQHGLGGMQRCIDQVGSQVEGVHPHLAWPGDTKL